MGGSQQRGLFLTFSYKKKSNRSGSLVVSLHFLALMDLLVMIRLERQMWGACGNFIGSEQEYF